MQYLIDELSAEFNKKSFKSTSAELTNYFARLVSQDIKRNLAKCYVLATEDKNVIGYYTLSSSAIPINVLPAKIYQKLRYNLFPVALIGRLAIDENHQGKGLGSVLLFDAIERVKKNSLGTAAIVVTAKDDNAQQFYEHFGFRAFEEKINGRTMLFYPLSTVFNVLNQ
ncbi:GNAT family N-acetyltransferase [Caviibacterium pharyngocola]|uniref:GNAT family N-acetyltransferase n=1 Tax=Caviibacterium pharyngocola TaxID=28159 RepID=A0A2M8RWS5_9PAST|nr:GNAT family N-acetyltransferase [Caviibacterium pharyngocola]PJG83339.1 GNAT family N-acetyltransferase [Caviibacterium pharyngocola]